MAQVTESEYCLAKEDPRLRQEFIESIDLGDAKKLIRLIKYSHKRDISQDYGQVSKWTENLMTFSYIMGHANFNRTTLLEVYKPAFNEQFYFFMNSFLHHELHHARQAHLDYGRKFREQLFNQGNKFDAYLELLIEIPAFHNQLIVKGELALKELEISHYNSDLLPKLDVYMKKQAMELNRDWKRDLSQVLCPSPYDDVVREVYGID